jgi:hypothetical protein
MKTTIGGDRLGSGNKQNISLRNYERSTHDLSYLWRSSMAPGTLVPFMNLVALPGDNFNIDLDCDVLTLPTIGPLFGSFKVQLDVFSVPVRLYNAALHMNKLNVGLDMSKVFLPSMSLIALKKNGQFGLEDHDQVNPSSLVKYLGISGIGKGQSDAGHISRAFNATPFLAYWDIYKNYYSNKQEGRGIYIHTDDSTLKASVVQANLLTSETSAPAGAILDNPMNITDESERFIKITFPIGTSEVDWQSIVFERGGSTTTLGAEFNDATWDGDSHTITTGFISAPSSNVTWEIPQQDVLTLEAGENLSPKLVEFPLENIDTMRERILQHSPTNTVFSMNSVDLAPYNLVNQTTSIGDENRTCIEYSQEGLGIKTYQSDLFNNWINTDWIDGTNGINEITSVDTSGDSFTIDALNLAQKVYVMLNRIAISGGSYDDWLDAVYTHERRRGVDSPVYMGSLIKELAFEEVISNSNFEGEDSQPLGTLAGRGRLTNKNKGGKINIRVDEPSIIMGLVSLTPRLDYSQGNDWSVNLKTLDDLHKPALDAIGFQELITEQMAWQSTLVNYQSGSPATITVTQRSAGKQPAWINYMTAVNKCYGNFAIDTKEMFMTLNRRYDINQVSGLIDDLTTYIDPVKYNQIFAETNIDAQNFWVQIASNITARRKMSAKVIPNL